MRANLSMLICILGCLGFILVLNMVWKKNLKTETQFPSSAFSDIFEEIQKKSNIKVEKVIAWIKKTFCKLSKKTHSDELIATKLKRSNWRLLLFWKVLSISARRANISPSNSNHRLLLFSKQTKTNNQKSMGNPRANI